MHKSSEGLASHHLLEGFEVNTRHLAAQQLFEVVEGFSVDVGEDLLDISYGHAAIGVFVKDFEYLLHLELVFTLVAREKAESEDESKKAHT